MQRLRILLFVCVDLINSISPCWEICPTIDQATHLKIIFFLNKINQSSILMQFSPTHIFVARHVLPLCNALTTIYQHIRMRCLISLQRPKSQRILNPLVTVLATPIWTFRYTFMRCNRGCPVVVTKSSASCSAVGQ
jgi:hypothetical protein